MKGKTVLQLLKILSLLEALLAKRLRLRKAIIAAYAPPAVHDPSTMAIWLMPAADMRAWL